jgi:hypothetical protein
MPRLDRQLVGGPRTSRLTGLLQELSKARRGLSSSIRMSRIYSSLVGGDGTGNIALVLKNAAERHVRPRRGVQLTLIGNDQAQVHPSLRRGLGVTRINDLPIQRKSAVVVALRFSSTPEIHHPANAAQRR